MSRALRLQLAVLVLVCGAALAQAEDASRLERGTAITDPIALRALDTGRFGISRMMMMARSADAALTSRQLFALPSMTPVRRVLGTDFDRYIAKHKIELPKESIGVGSNFDFQLFDRDKLDSDNTRFVLSGIVNRMDRAYVSRSDCGEVRLIYRLTETRAADIGDAAVSPRLPMTLNLVLKARPAAPVDHEATNCAEIARRWLAADELNEQGVALAEILTAPDGALDLIRPENIARVETNLQIAHAPKSSARDFRTDYLLKVFDYDAKTQTFEEAPLENQIDRDGLLTDRNLARDFKSWLLEPAHLAELDRGTILVPERFLLKSAVAATPVGFSPSKLQPAFGLMAGEAAKDPVFSESDVVGALKAAAERGIVMQNIRSPAGFERRLNDMTCTGCHQTRGIGGFHFPGVDWMAAKPSNSTIVPASPHFFGDQIRRRDILAAFRDGKEPDFSRGFAARPQTRGSAELAGTEYEDGWGAHCYVRHAKASENDASFRSWTCAEGLACQPASADGRMGMCFVGQPLGRAKPN
jgi:hypothetical protein